MTNEQLIKYWCRIATRDFFREHLFIDEGLLKAYKLRYVANREQEYNQYKARQLNKDLEKCLGER